MACRVDGKFGELLAKRVSREVSVAQRARLVAVCSLGLTVARVGSMR